MISIIICSRSQTIPAELFENIKNTIGFEFELIVIDNYDNKYSIFEAYNLGIEKSKGEYLCFIHDDIIIHTNGWGDIVRRIFKEDQQIGLIGVAGSKIKTKMPSGLWNCPEQFKEINIIQHLENEKVKKWNFGFKNCNISQVVAIDGVFMVMKKDKKLFFHKEMTGFHNYDLNISFECKIKGYKIMVTNEILVEHYSNGTINKSWYDSALKIHLIYDKILPLNIDNKFDNFNLKSLEIKNGYNFLKHYLTFGYQEGVFKLWFKFFLLVPFSKLNVEIFKNFIKSFLKLKKV